MSFINFYRISSPNTEFVYIGSTVKTIQQRLIKHENNYKHYLEGKYPFVSSYDILEVGDYKINLIESIICETKQDRDMTECKHIINNNSCNVVMPGRTEKQYLSQWYEKNKEQLQQHRSAKHSCICGGNYTTSHKTEHFKSKKHINYHIHIHIHNH